MPRSAAPLLLLVVAGCALTAPPRDALPDGGDAAGGEFASGSALLDRRASEALAASEQRPDDADAALAAASLLFQAADLRLQLGSLAALDALAEADLEDVLGADERVDDAVRAGVLGQCSAGLAAVDRAAALRPDDVAVQLQRGLHLSLIAWANGPARSLLAGHGPKLVGAIEAAVVLDPRFDHGAPLRLQGRFRGKAPWPYGDVELARSSLERACELAPIAVNHLFLGDVLWSAGDAEGARRQWLAATTAAGDESTRWSLAALQELARRRLAALP
jgi:hypothetical protein